MTSGAVVATLGAVEATPEAAEVTLEGVVATSGAVAVTLGAGAVISEGVAVTLEAAAEAVEAAMTTGSTSIHCFFRNIASFEVFSFSPGPNRSYFSRNCRNCLKRTCKKKFKCSPNGRDQCCSLL